MANLTLPEDSTQIFSGHFSHIALIPNPPQALSPVPAIKIPLILQTTDKEIGTLCGADVSQRLEQLSLQIVLAGDRHDPQDLPALFYA